MTYKDGFTLDGLLKPGYHVSKEKVAAADKLLAEAFRGNHIAEGQLREVHTTSDLKFNLAHLVTSIAIPQFDEAERTWTNVAGTRTVPNFGPVQLYSLYGKLTGAGVAAGGGLPRVAEAENYPYVTIEGQESFYQKLGKLGAKFGFTWESNVDDLVGFFQQMPGELVNLALDSEEREVFEALINGTTQVLAAQTLPDETVTRPNAPISPEAIWAAILQLQNVEVNGRKVGKASGYNVIVPLGTADFINWKLRQTVIAIQDGAITYAPNSTDIFNNISIVETDRLSGLEWIVIPKPNAIRRPVLELLRLRGYERPELRVHNDTGTYVGGSAVSPFEGSFDNDTIDYRVRYVAGGVMWDTHYSLKSNGSGVA